MYFDALTLAAVAAELEASLIGARVQDIIPLSADGVGLELYARPQRQYLLLSADQRAPRVHLAAGRLRRGVEVVSALILRLRKELDGAHLAAVEQPAFERVLALVFEAGSGEEIELVAECIERRANIVLVQAGVVLECARRVGADVNRARVTLPGQPYAPPPAQIKHAPDGLTAAGLGAVLAAQTSRTPSQPAWRALVGALRGVSPLAAREALFRATGATETAVADVREPEALLAALQALLGPLAGDAGRAWEPCLALEEGEPVAYAPYRLTHLETAALETGATMSATLERYYGRSGTDPYAGRKAAVRAQLDAAAQRLANRGEALAGELAQADQLDALRQAGELILAYAHAISSGQRELRAAYEVDGPEQVITLDPQLRPVQNAQAYFRRYEKARAAARELPGLLEAVTTDQAYLEQLRADLELADSFPAIDEVRQALAEAGWLGAPARAPARRGAPAGGPRRVVSPDGIVIWVGRSARQNEEVTFRRARPDDLWLHVRDGPGAHVVVASGGRTVPERTLVQAAGLAARHSPRRGETGVAVVVTERKLVRKVPGGRPGLVTYRGERTLTVDASGDPSGDEGAADG
jgi:predicted ribosome quality control (RQC) complex YloA/Tae2 family protein